MASGVYEGSESRYSKNNSTCMLALHLHKKECSSSVSSASSQADGQQNGWKYYRAKGIDELISANIIMCGLRASALDRAGCFSDQQRACVRSTNAIEWWDLSRDQTRSVGRITSRLVQPFIWATGRGLAAETGEDRARDSAVSCFEPRLACHCNCRCVPSPVSSGYS